MASSLTTWVAARLTSLSDVESCSIVDEVTIEIVRKRMSKIVIACVSMDYIDGEHVVALKVTYPQICFILNVPKACRIGGKAFAEAESLGVAVGRFGDLMRAIALNNPGTYVFAETAYVERILRQHSRISSFERLDDKRYVIKRYDLPDLKVLISCDYQVTVEAIRDAIDRYGEFDAYVTSSPNATIISPQTAEAAASTGRQTYLWREFLSALNR